MNISKIKLVWNYLTGGSTKVLDYILDVANNAVNKLDDTSKENIAKVLSAIKRIIDTAVYFRCLVPEKWNTAYSMTLDALADVATACGDLKITSEELVSVVTSWQKAYSSWRAE